MTPQTPVRWSPIGSYSDVLLERSDEPGINYDMTAGHRKSICCSIVHQSKLNRIIFTHGIIGGKCFQKDCT
jgi:hypothetical protein